MVSFIGTLTQRAAPENLMRLQLHANLIPPGPGLAIEPFPHLPAHWTAAWNAPITLRPRWMQEAF